MYEDIPNHVIIEGIAVPGVFTSYRLRMAAGERILQQEVKIKELETLMKKVFDIYPNIDLEIT